MGRPTEPAPAVDVLEIMAERIAEKIAEKLADRLPAARLKELWTTEELAERYGMSKASIRRRIRAGEFGDVVTVGGRTRLVTLDGMRAFESAHTGQAGPAAQETPARRKKIRENPGRI